MKSDTVNLPPNVLGIYVGGTGDVAAVMGDGSVAVFSAVPAGTTLLIAPVRINSTSTSATLMLALFAS